MLNHASRDVYVLRQGAHPMESPMESVESPKTSQVNTMQQAPEEGTGDFLPDGRVVFGKPPENELKS